jgi:class 3 adenylate cyclase
MDGIATLRAQTLHTSVAPLMIWDSTPSPRNGVADFLLRHWMRRDRSVTLVEIGAKQAKTQRRIAQAPKVVPPNLAETQAMDPSQQIRTLLFADTAGYSRLTDAQLPLFRKYVLDPIADLVADFTAKTPGEMLEKNTWGDALYFVFASIAAAGNFALDLRDVLRQMPWASIGLPESLGLRIALHCGPVYTRFEPITGRINHCGAHVNLASRIEPITPIGHVYASQAFAALAQAEGLTHIKCDYVGQVSLAKGYGTFPMYHVHRWDDPE